MILRDLTRKGQPFYELLKPAPAVKRPSSPTVITPPLIASGVRNLASSVFNNLFTQTSTKPACITVQDRSTSPVFSITYEKLPASSTTVFSDRLEVVTAPLSFTVVPGMLDRLKKFFSTKECDEGTAYELDSEVLSTAARDKYDGWMKRTQGEIRRSVKRIIDGKSKAKVSQKRWAISLDIFAPEILIPDDCSKLNSNILVLNLGHMTFDNHAGEAGRSRKKTTDAMDESPSEQSGGSQEENDDDDNEDFDTFVTPPNTPPSELDLNPPSASVTTELEQTVDERETSTAPDGGESLCDDTAVDINPKQLSEQVLREKMDERYRLNVSDLQVCTILIL
uniref:Vacuolar protein sorting-associated protein 13D n=1 Tax=Phallusia mammillata TaxID=59560 RepID=A0A6F9DX73_9ASCI|nr:vacuolar protein sorting-associated protein 13D [Phallusia mammillata]